MINVDRTVLMHDVGHSVCIVDISEGNEVYYSNSQCVMAQATAHNCIDNPFYCAHHWRKRDFT